MTRKQLRWDRLSGNAIFLIGTALSLILLIVEGVLSSLIFHDGSLFRHFAHPTVHDYLIHYLPALFLIAFSALTQFVVKQYFEVESSLKDRENRLRVMTEQMPALIWTTDKNLMLTSYSGFGLSNLVRDGRIGKDTSLFEFVNEADSDFPIVEIHMKALRGESIRQELNWNGRYYSVYLEPIRDAKNAISGCIGIALDITDEKSTREALERSEARLSGILEVASDAIVATDAEGKIILFNSGAQRIFGHTSQAISGSSFSILLPERHRVGGFSMQGFADELGRATEGRREIFAVRKDGSELPVEASISRLDLNGERTFMVILRDISPRKETEELILSLAYSDPLTGLPNRTKLHDLLEDAVREARRNERLVAFLLIDLDRFKEVNDTLGHQRGDLLLQEVASRLKSVLRPEDRVARMGGDEFGLVLQIARAIDAAIVADKVKTALESPYEIEGIPVALDASIGIALAPDHGANADALIQRADVAMYASKETASGYSIYSTKLDRHSPRRLALMGELRNAIEQGQLRLHYQPQLAIPSLAVEGIESLVRWPHSIFGLVPPDQFIIPAEQTGLIEPLTRWVLREALRQCALLRSRGYEIRTAANLSARNLQNRQLPKLVEELLESAGLPASALGLEVTESAIMADPDRGIEILHELSSLGVNLAIDDFGTGYSSLSSLKELPVRELKIDKSFIRSLSRDSGNDQIVRSTIDLAHNLRLKVVAEGVEDQPTLERLVELGCDSIQGFHVCTPLPGPELEEWIEEQSGSGKKTARR